MTTGASVSRTAAVRPTGSLGWRLALPVLALVWIPLLLMGGATYVRTRPILQGQAEAQLRSVAQAQVQALQRWTSARELQLQLAAQRPALVGEVSELAGLSSSSPEVPSRVEVLRSLLAGLQLSKGEILFSDLLILSTPGGEVLVSTRPEWEAARPAGLDPFLSTSEVRTRPLLSDPLLAPNNLALVTMVPILVEGDPAPSHLLVGLNTGADLGRLMQELRALLEASPLSEVKSRVTYFLVEPDTIVRLTEDGTMPEAVQQSTNSIFQLTDPGTSGTLGFWDPTLFRREAAVEWLPGWDMAAVVDVSEDEVFSGLVGLGLFTAVLVTAAAAVTILVVVSSANQFLQPVTDMAKFAQRFSMGDWSQRVPVERDDELGAVAGALNRMAEDLTGLYRQLEARVEERTRQIRTAADIGREAASILDMESLLHQVVDLISSRFGYYHAGVFLLDETGEYAVLRATSSEGGKRMLQRGHRLQVGKVGIVGYVTGTGKARISLDVGKDAAHLANPDLPATRSEMALPLKVGDAVIGALDVQSVENDAFDEADVAVLQIMADQLAIAIQNTRLIEEQILLASRRRKVIEVFQQLTRLGSYDRLLADVARMVREALGYSSVVVAQLEGNDLVVRSVSAQRGLPVPSIGEAIPMGHGILGRAAGNRAPAASRERETAALASDVEPGSPVPRGLAVPLLSRGQVIGSMAVQANEPGEFPPEDIETLELLASQVGASLDNAKLFEETEASLRQVDALYRKQASDTWKQIAAQRGERQLVSSIELAPIDQLSAAQEETRLRAPIAMRGEAIGSIELEGIQSGEYAADDESILRAVAEEVAGALEQARLMEEINRRATQLQTAAEIARDATGLLDLGTLLSRAVNLIRERFQFYQVSVFLLDEARQFAHLLETAGSAGQTLKTGTRPIPVASRTVIGHVATTGKPHVVHDKTGDPYFQEDPSLAETESEAGIPLRTGEHVLGVLDVKHTIPNAFGMDMISVLSTLADQLAVAIQNARLYEQAIRRARREQTLIEIAGKIRTNQSIEGMLQTAVSELRRALRAKQGRIWLANLDRELPGDGGSEKG